jgi:hypothetical protein
MMRMSTVQAMKVLAASNFKLKDVKFEGFESLEETKVETTKDSDEDMYAQLDVWANMSISYEGEAPDTYRVLNATIMDWVEENDDDLKKVINPKLVPFLKGQYPDVDVSDLQQDFDDYIWEDQVDYMPDVDDEAKTIKFSIELVLDIEEPDDEDDGDDE